MSFMAHLLLFAIIYNTNTSLQTTLIQYYLVTCLIASFVYNRTKEFVNKIYGFILITITAYTLKKQRHKLAKTFLILNFIFFLPYVLPVIILSSLLNASLLPLFTFPIFLIGFPRSKRFWPQQQSIESDKAIMNRTNRDSFFYKQMIPNLTKSLQECILTGKINNDVLRKYFKKFFLRKYWLINSS